MEIIDNYNKLTLGKYQDILKVNADKDMDGLDKQVRTLSILADLSEEEILHLPIGEYKDMAAKSRFLEDTDITPRTIAKKYVIGDWELIPVTDYRKLEAGQYIDFRTYSEDVDSHLAELISVLLVPKGHRYNEGYDIIEVQKALKDGMTVSEGVSIAAFFLSLCKQSIADSLNYSEQMAKGIPDKETRTEILKQIAEQRANIR